MSIFYLGHHSSLTMTSYVMFVQATVPSELYSTAEAAEEERTLARRELKSDREEPTEARRDWTLKYVRHNIISRPLEYMKSMRFA